MTDGFTVKVCGMRHASNVRDVASLGVHMIGFIFHPSSPRSVIGNTPVPREASGDAVRVGVFVNSTRDEVSRAIDEWSLDAVQYHGEESPDICARTRERFKVIVSKAFHVHGESSLHRTLEYDGSCDLYLFDSPGPNYGGNGVPFDWNQLDRYAGKTPYLVAGGIDDLVAARFHEISNLPHFTGVDLNSRVESAPGMKCCVKVARVIEQVRSLSRSTP
jgi:phosphoribosylanthranilate isomerase